MWEDMHDIYVCMYIHKYTHYTHTYICIYGWMYVSTHVCMPMYIWYMDVYI